MFFILLFFTFTYPDLNLRFSQSSQKYVLWRDCRLPLVPLSSFYGKKRVNLSQKHEVSWRIEHLLFLGRRCLLFCITTNLRCGLREPCARHGSLTAVLTAHNFPGDDCWRWCVRCRVGLYNTGKRWGHSAERGSEDSNGPNAWLV